jgi:hypothetical protein
MENLSKKAAKLSSEQLELLKKKVSEKAIKNENKNSKIVHFESEDGSYPLSFNQERLWLAENSGLNPIVAGMIKLQGQLDSEVLEKSVSAVKQQHKVLKHVFGSNDRLHTQKIKEDSAPSFEREQCSDQKDFDIQEFITTDIKGTTWDIGNGPLLKIKLIKHSEKEHFLFVKAHPLVFDVASITIFLNDLIYCYEQYCDGKEPEWDKAAVQYLDFAYWQRKVCSQDMHSKLQNYWSNKLNKISSVNIEDVQIQPTEETLDPVSFQVSADILKELKVMARREGVTLYILLLAAFFCLRYKYDEKQQACIGSYTSTRNSVELEQMIGSLETETAFLINLSDNMNFRELLNIVRDEVLETYTYPYIPILENEPDKPVSRAMFLLNSEPAYKKEVKGLMAELIESYQKQAFKDMILSLQENEQELRGKLMYSGKLSEENAAIKMTENFLHILKEIIKNPGVGLSDIKIKVKNESKEENYTEIEERLIAIWKDVLNCDWVGVNDNFFEIGGNSLRLVRVQEAIEKIYPGKLTIAKLFSYPTISGLAAFIEGETGASDDTEMNVPVALLPLPLDYFINEGDENEDIVLKASISEDEYDNLLMVSKDIEIDVTNILLAIYVYLLSETIGQQQITVQTMINNNELVYPLSMNMENITDFSELFNAIYKKTTGIQESDTYPLKLAGSMQLNKAENSIMTMFTNQEVTKDGFMQNYDIIIKLKQDSNDVSISCEYNAGRLKKDKLEELLSDYTNLIKILIERMI